MKTILVALAFTLVACTTTTTAEPAPSRCAQAFAGRWTLTDTYDDANARQPAPCRDLTGTTSGTIEVDARGTWTEIGESGRRTPGTLEIIEIGDRCVGVTSSTLTIDGTTIELTRNVEAHADGTLSGDATIRVYPEGDAAAITCSGGTTFSAAR